MILDKEILLSNGSGSINEHSTGSSYIGGNENSGIDNNYDGGKIHGDLLRALCSNSRLQHVIVLPCFLNSLNENKIRIFIEMIGRLPNLETL